MNLLTSDAVNKSSIVPHQNTNSLVVASKNVDARRWSFASMHSAGYAANEEKNKLEQMSIPSEQFRLVVTRFSRVFFFFKGIVSLLSGECDNS